MKRSKNELRDAIKASSQIIRQLHKQQRTVIREAVKSAKTAQKASDELFKLTGKTPYQFKETWFPGLTEYMK